MSLQRKSQTMAVWEAVEDGKVVTVGFNHVTVGFNHMNTLVVAEAEDMAEVMAEGINLAVGISPTSKTMARPNVLAIGVGWPIIGPTDAKLSVILLNSTWRA